MTKISIYQIDEKVTSSDKWIGSDGDNQYRTKNFTPTKIAQYFNENEIIDTSNSIRYRYDTIAVTDSRKQGTISFETEIGPLVPIDIINTFILSKDTQGGNDVSNFLNILPTTKVILHKSNDIDIFGIFRISSVNDYLVDPGFFVVNLQFLSGNGSLEEDKDYIISLIDLQNVIQVPQLIKETFEYESSNIFTLSETINNVLQVIVNSTSLHPEAYSYTLPNTLTVINELHDGDVITIVYNYVEEFFDVPNLQSVTDTGSVTTNPITADSFVKSGGDGTNILLDNGDVLPIGDLPSSVTETSQLINDGEDGVNPFITAQDLPVYSDFIQDSITNGVIDKAPTENAVYDALQLKQDLLGYTPVNRAGDTMTGSLILNGDPFSDLEAATKQYVDNISSGIVFHSPVYTATTANLSANYTNGVSGVGAKLTATTNGAIQVDGEFPGYLERVLVWHQNDQIENGVYDITVVGDSLTPFELTRSTDADNSPPGELAYGDYTFVLSGFTNGGRGFICNTLGIIVIGVTDITFVQFNAAQVTTPGYGLQAGSSPGVIEINTTQTQEKITFTTTGTTGAATFIGNALNIPNKQDTLVSGVNIKTVGGVTLLDSGDIPLIYPVIETTSGYTLTNADNGKIIIFKTTAAQTLNIPLLLTDGFECTFVTLSNVVLTIPAVSGITLNNAANPTGSNTLLPQLTFTLKRMLTPNTYIATGNI